tara:strand:- start:602 stop:844 length:243 start_codon:yes stop_codon:yes gene_type:complete
MITVRCKDCGREVTDQSGSCGCPNMVRIKGDVVTALDLTRTIMVSSNNKHNKIDGLSSQDLQWQEERRKRKVRKLDFEIR